MDLFGNKRKALEKRGVRVEAKLISANGTGVFTRSGSGSVQTNVKETWKLELEITPVDGGAPFRASLKEPYPEHGAPVMHDKIWVVYDPEDHGNVDLDRSDFDKIDQLKEALGAEAALAELERWKARGMVSERQFQAARDRMLGKN
jgi:hypothetical protein